MTLQNIAILRMQEAQTVVRRFRLARLRPSYMKPESQAHTILRDLSSGYSVSAHRCQLDNNAGGVLGTLKKEWGCRDDPSDGSRRDKVSGKSV